MMSILWIQCHYVEDDSRSLVDILDIFPSMNDLVVVDVSETYSFLLWILRVLQVQGNIMHPYKLVTIQEEK